MTERLTHSLSASKWFAGMVSPSCAGVSPTACIHLHQHFHVIKYSERHSDVCLRSCGRYSLCFQQLPGSSPPFCCHTRCHDRHLEESPRWRAEGRAGRPCPVLSDRAHSSGLDRGGVSLEAWAVSWAPRGHSCPVSGKHLFWEEAPPAGTLTFAPLPPTHRGLLCLLPR